MFILVMNLIKDKLKIDIFGFNETKPLTLH